MKALLILAAIVAAVVVIISLVGLWMIVVRNWSDE